MRDSTLLGIGYFGGIAAGVLICWIREIVLERMRIRRSLRALRPRTTVELEGTHQR